MSTYDVTGAIIEFEGGTLSTPKTLELFQHLVDTGLAWQLQGSYGRMAHRLLEQGLIFGQSLRPAWLDDPEAIAESWEKWAAKNGLGD